MKSLLASTVLTSLESFLHLLDIHRNGNNTISITIAIGQTKIAQS